MIVLRVIFPMKQFGEEILYTLFLPSMFLIRAVQLRRFESTKLGVQSSQLEDMSITECGRIFLSTSALIMLLHSPENGVDLSWVGLLVGA